MENSLLHKAHQFRRKAERLSKQGKFSEAALCHLEAAKHLQNLEQQISRDSPVFRSLEEQCQYHQRHAELAQALRETAEKQRALKAKKKSILNPSDSSSSLPPSIVSRIKPMAISDIRRNFEDFDSLLQILSERKTTTTTTTTSSSELKEVQNTKFVEFTIRPKNDAEVIEELQTVNGNLRTLVDKLLNELKTVQEEKEALEKKLLAYESKEKPVGQKELASSNKFLIELDEKPSLDLYDELAPLETPDFNFS